MKTRISFFVLLLITLGLGIAYYPKNEVLPLAKGSDVVNYRVQDSHARRFDAQGKLSHLLEANDLLHFKDGHSHLHAVELTLFPDNQAPVKIQAREALADQEGKVITLQDHVHITQQIDHKNTREFFSERVLYDANRQQATTALPVLLKQADANISGDGMKLDMQKKRLRLNANVKAQLQPTKGEKIIITANRADIREHNIRFLGHVLLRQGTTKIHAHKLHVFTDTTNTLQRVVAVGAPATSQGWPQADKPPVNARAQQMTYKVKKQWITLTGDGFIRQGKNSFAAPHIDYDVKQQRVLTQKNKQQQTVIKLFPENENGQT